MRKAAIWLSFILVFTIPWENALNVLALGTASKLVGFLAATAWLSLALIERRFRKPHPFHLVMFLFFFWNIMSFFWSVTVDETVERIKTYVLIAIMAWILWDLYDAPNALRGALQAYILGAYVTIGCTLFNFFSGQTAGIYGERYTAGAHINANDLALTLALAFPIAWYLAISAAKEKKKNFLLLVNYAYIPAAFFAITLTASRTALFTLIPAIVYMVGTANGVKPIFRVLILAALIGTLPFVPPSITDRLSTVGESISKGDLGGRGRIWVESLTILSEHPLLGVGSGSLKRESLLGTVAHNTYLSVLAELGLIGFIFFVVTLGIGVYQAASQPKWLCRLWLTVLAVWVVGVFALSWEARKTTWLFLNLIVCSGSLFSRSDSTGKTSSFSKEPHVFPAPSATQEKYRIWGR